MRRGLGGIGSCPLLAVPPINSQCTNYILFDVALQLPLDSKGGLIHPFSGRRRRRCFWHATLMIA